MNDFLMLTGAFFISGTLLAGWAVAEGTQTFGKQQNPAIKEYGSIVPVPGAAFQPKQNVGTRVIFDVSKMPQQRNKPLPGLMHAAKYLNAYAMAGVQPKEMDIIAIVHGPAGVGVMANSVYKAKYNVDNPNEALIKELTQAGVRVYVCAQTLHESNFQLEQVLDDVIVALSAMIVLTQAQDQGFAVLEY